jgi:hypothetical protein
MSVAAFEQLRQIKNKIYQLSYTYMYMYHQSINIILISLYIFDGLPILEDHADFCIIFN